MRKVRTRGSVSAVMVVALAVAACGGGGPADRAGGDVRVLKLATIDSVNNNGQSYGPETFVNQLAAVSGGHFRVEVQEVFGDGAVTAESDLVKAIASGELDGGWPSTRAFAGAGITGLRAVEAPLVLGSYAAERELVQSPVAETLLAQLDGTGIKGLGLAVGPLRRPFAKGEALLGPEDWQGISFRAFNSPVQDDTISALGATPLHMSFEWQSEMEAGRLHGAEFDVAQSHASSLLVADQVTANVVLWPKVFVLGLSQRTYDALSEQERGWVMEAASRATRASVDGDYDEAALAETLCEQGMRFPMATDAQVQALRDRVAPVIEGLAGDPASGPLLAEIRTIGEAHPTDVVEVPDDCRAGTGAGGLPEIPETTAPIADGDYRVDITPADLQRAGVENGPGWTGTWTLTITDGMYAMYCRALEDPAKDCGNSGIAAQAEPYEAGELRGTATEAYFVFSPELMSELTGCELPVSDADGHCYELDPYGAAWSLDGDTLTFQPVGGEIYYNLTVNPWSKID